MFLMIIVPMIVLVVIFWQISTLISIYGGIAYVGTNPEILRHTLELAQLKKDEIFYELGAGLGEGLVIASKDFQAKAMGIEISPFHWLIAKFRTINDKNIKVFLGNFAKINLASADVIYCYLSPKLMVQLLPKLQKELKPGSRVVSLAFDFPNKKPHSISMKQKKKIFLYRF